MFKICTLVVVVLSINWILLSACKSLNTTENIKCVENFEIEKYLGTWYEIARLPHYFEENMEFVSANYSMDKNNIIRVTNSGKKNGELKKINGKVRFATNPDEGELEVSFVTPFWSKYRIIYLSDDYKNAVVTSKYKNYLWILSRDKQISPVELVEILSKTSEWGFDNSKLYYPKTF